jgi:PAS domain-containing protein
MFEAALEVLPDVVLIHDEQLILFANAACRSVLAAETPEDLEGQPIELIVHPDAFAAGRERRRLLLDGDRILRGIPLKVIALDGKTRHLTADAHPLVFRGVKVGMVVATQAPF